MYQNHSRDRGTFEDPYRGDRLEVSYRGWCCGGCGCGAWCIGHPGREVYGPALKALRSHLHKGTTVGRAQRAIHWAWRRVWGTSFLLLPLWGIISTHVIPDLCTAPTVDGPVMAGATADLRPCSGCASHSGVKMFHLMMPKALTVIDATARLSSGVPMCSLNLLLWAPCWGCTLSQEGANLQGLKRTWVLALSAISATYLLWWYQFSQKQKKINHTICNNVPLLAAAVPVYDAASAVSPACISPFVLSDTHSAPDEAEAKDKSLREQFSRNSSQTEDSAKWREATHGRMNAITISYLIGQISNLALQPLNLPPQVFFFLIHSLSVTPLFSEVLLKYFDLKFGHINEEYIPLLPQKAWKFLCRPHNIWPVPSAQLFASAVPVSSDCWQRRQNYPGQVVVGRMKVNEGLRLLPKPDVRKTQHEHVGTDHCFVFSCSTGVPHSPCWGVEFPSPDTPSVCSGAAVDPAGSESSASAPWSQSWDTLSHPETRRRTDRLEKHIFFFVCCCC